MKAKDVIEQLVGDFDGWAINDTLSFQIYNPSKFPEEGSADVDFQKGIVRLFNRGKDKENGKVSKAFAIKATLEPLDPNPDQD